MAGAFGAGERKETERVVEIQDVAIKGREAVAIVGNSQVEADRLDCDA